MLGACDSLYNESLLHVSKTLNKPWRFFLEEYPVQLWDSALPRKNIMRVASCHWHCNHSPMVAPHIFWNDGSLKGAWQGFVSHMLWVRFRINGAKFCYTHAFVLELMGVVQPVTGQPLIFTLEIAKSLTSMKFLPHDSFPLNDIWIAIESRHHTGWCSMCTFSLVCTKLPLHVKSCLCQ